MKKIILIATIILIVLATIGLFPRTAHEAEISTLGPVFTALEPRVFIPTPRSIWLDKLVMCESGGDPNAINPIDLDGTASLGLLQFKVGTFLMYLDRYEMEGELMDGEVQKAIVRRMMDDPKVRWENEFPDCVRLLGRPPVK